MTPALRCGLAVQHIEGQQKKRPTPAHTAGELTCIGAPCTNAQACGPGIARCLQCLCRIATKHPQHSAEGPGRLGTQGARSSVALRYVRPLPTLPSTVTLPAGDTPRVMRLPSCIAAPSWQM